VPQQGTAVRELLLPHPVGQEAEVAHPLAAMRRDMQQQSSQEFHRLDRAGAQAVAALVVLIAEGHLAVLQRHQPVVGDGHPTGIAGQVREHRLGLPEGFLGIDHPLRVTQGREPPLPRGGLGERPTAPRQGELALAIEVLQPRQVQSPKASREDADGQEEVGATRYPTRPIRSHAPRREDTMEMWMVMQLLAPGMEHGKAPHLRTEMLWVLGDILESLRHRAKEQPIEEAGVLQREGPRACGRVKTTWT
jgi:hypothetical protein